MATPAAPTPSTPAAPGYANCTLEFLVRPPFVLDKPTHEVRATRVDFIIVGQAAVDQRGQGRVYLGGERFHRNDAEKQQDVWIASFYQQPGRLTLKISQDLPGISSDPMSDLLTLDVSYSLWLRDPEIFMTRLKETEYDDQALINKYRAIEGEIEKKANELIQFSRDELVSGPDPRSDFGRIATGLDGILRSWGLYINFEETTLVKREPEKLWDIVSQIRIAEDTYLHDAGNAGSFLNVYELEEDRQNPNLGRGEGLLNQVFADSGVLNLAVAWMRTLGLHDAANTLEYLAPPPISGTPEGQLSLKVIRRALLRPYLGVGEWLEAATGIHQSFLQNQARGINTTP